VGVKGKYSYGIFLLSIVFLVGCITGLFVTYDAFSTSGKSGDWYYFDWVRNAPYAPSFKVLDTESSLGPYASRTKTITLNDLIKFHGHACDGLFTAASALYVGFKNLYPDGIIDRTDTGCITNNSPCYGDVAAYLCGGRIRFGTQKIDKRLQDAFILYRFSTYRAVKVSLKSGVFPKEVKELEDKVKTGNFSIEEMRKLQKLQWEFARDLIGRPLEDSFFCRSYR